MDGGVGGEVGWWVVSGDGGGVCISWVVVG